MPIEFNVGDTVKLKIPNNDTPSNGMPGVVKSKAIFKCGNLHYEVKWSTGGLFFVPWDWLDYS